MAKATMKTKSDNERFPATDEQDEKTLRQLSDEKLISDTDKDVTRVKKILADRLAKLRKHSNPPASKVSALDKCIKALRVFENA